MHDKPRLVVRRCKCGCGRTWRALASSPNEYAMISHMPQKDRPNPWVTHSGRFRNRVFEWLALNFGPHEKVSDFEILDEIG